MNRQDFFYDQLVKQMDLDLLQDNAERGIGVGLKDTWGTGLSSIDIIAHENGSPDMNVLVPAGSARVQETGTIKTTGTLTNGSPIITDIPNTARLSKGDNISGTGVPGSTKILTVGGINQITMDKNSTADGSAVDLTVTYIKYTRAVWIAEQTIDCSQDWEANSTIPAAGKECYIACYVKQKRDLWDQRQDGFDPPNTIDYRQIEGAEFRVYKGADANPASATKVSSPGDEYKLVFEVLFDENTTAISDAVDEYNPGKDEIDYTDVVFVRSQELKDALGDRLFLKDKLDKNIKVVSFADYTVTDIDGVGIMSVATGSANRTIDLPTLADNQGRILEIYKEDFTLGDVIVDGENGETMNGALTIKLPRQYSKMKIIAGATEWKILSLHHTVARTGWVNRSDWVDAHLGSVNVSYDNLAVSTFQVGEIVTETGGNACTGIIVANNGTTLVLEQVTNFGVFGNNNVITGGTSGATADVDHVAGTNKNIDTNMNHLLDTGLNTLSVRLFISTDGAEDNSYEISGMTTDFVANHAWGLQKYAVDSNTIKLQTGEVGMQFILDDGKIGALQANDVYYEVIISKRVI